MAESISDRVDELLQPANTKKGDALPDEVASLRPTCTMAEENYQAILGLIKTMKEAEVILQRFHAHQEGVTPESVQKAKEQHDQARQTYLQAGNQINDGIKAVNGLARIYVEDMLVQNLYKTYLAKLLASLETRNPVEPFVRRLADWVFVFDREPLVVSEEENRRGLTLEKKRTELLAASNRTMTMLETRYQKRLLQNRLKAGESSGKVIRRLHYFAQQDPEDLHTTLWLASLMSKELVKERNPTARSAQREEILQLCKKAMGQIDDFLNLQGIQVLSERDKRRAEYVKSIGSIRNPLVRD
jgi:hypothetical protein